MKYESIISTILVYMFIEGQNLLMVADEVHQPAKLKLLGISL